MNDYFEKARHESRGALIRMLMSPPGRLSRDDANMALDMAEHATGEALTTLKRVAGLVPSPELQKITEIMALKMLQANSGIMLEAMTIMAQSNIRGAPTDADIEGVLRTAMSRMG